MPVLTFLHDALAFAKGPYYRHVGRYTKTFCSRAARRAKTPLQRRVWFATAISADEVIASLARLEDRRQTGSLAGWQVQPKADRRRYLKAIHVYLSALLLLYGSCKEELLAKMGMTEGEFMTAWQDVFQYDAADQVVFDKVLMPAFRERGIDGLVTATGELIREALFRPDSPFGKPENAALQDLMVDDLAALKRNLARPDAGRSEEKERKA